MTNPVEPIEILLTMSLKLTSISTAYLLTKSKSMIATKLPIEDLLHLLATAADITISSNVTNLNKSKKVRLSLRRIGVQNYRIGWSLSNSESPSKQSATNSLSIVTDRREMIRGAYGMKKQKVSMSTVTQIKSMNKKRRIREDSKSQTSLKQTWKMN